MKAYVKAGRLVNGWERGKGTVVHAVSENSAESVCGQRPAIAWAERELHQINCAKCMDKVRADEKLRDEYSRSSK